MLVFIDETGDHNLTTIDKNYPIFALGALLIEEDESIKMNQIVNEIKKDFFADDGTFILHSSELRRPSHKKSDSRNKIMNDPAIRESFYKTFETKVMQGIDFRLVICLIEKHKFTNNYRYPADPYLFCFENLLNRIIRHGGQHNAIYSEKRGQELDAELRAEYEKRCKVGVRFYLPEIVTQKTSLDLIEKKQNINGLQVIDLIMACYVKHHMGKKHKMVGNDITPDSVFGKLACGVTVFP